MTLGIPCNSCANGSCGNCVAEKSKTLGFIRSAKYHCSCANKGHSNSISKDLPNKTVFSSKRDVEPTHPRETLGNFNDNFEEDES